MPRLPSVRDHMDESVHTLSPDTDIMAAIDFLIANKVTGAPVVDSTASIVGVLTEKDCLQVLAMGSDGERSRGKVSAFMSTDVTTIPPDMNIYYAAGLFLHHSFRRLPVVEKGRLVGAITRFDILRAVSQDHQLVLGD